MVRFLINSTLLGVGVAMDAFSVSVANGLNEPNMPIKKSFFVSGLFGFFQAIMPLIGWFCVHSILNKFENVARIVPVIAFLILMFLGGQMIYEGAKRKECKTVKKLSFGGWIIQAIATSIDALSVGFTIATYGFFKAILSSLIIFIIAFTICLLGFFVGKKFGSVLTEKATICGGVILMLIGVEILVLSLI